MTKYKSDRIIDGRHRTVIVDETETGTKIVNRNPTKEELKGLEEEPYIRKIIKKYNGKNTCPRIRDGDECGNELKSGHAHRERDKEGNWTGRWICDKCRKIEYHKEYRERSDCYNNIIKSVANRRINCLDPNSAQAKGDISQTITCYVHNVKDLNLENDNYCSPIDHSRHPVLGILQSKGRLYNSLEKYWHASISNEHGKEFDNLIFYCYDKNMKIIIRVYIFPKDEIIKRTSICIYNNDKFHWYDKYRVDEKPYNDTYQNILDKNR